MGPYLGDFDEDATVHFLWSSNDGDGAAITRATNGTVSVYKDNGVTQSTAGVTDTEDFDSLTGIHACTIDTSADAFYATGANYSVVLSAATIDGQTVNAVLAHFSIENRFDDVNVTSMAANTITAPAIENDAITADKLATDCITNDELAVSALAEIQTSCETALDDRGLDHLLSASVAGTDVTDNSIIAKLVSSSATADWDDFVNTTDSLQAIADSGGGGPTAAQIADAVLQESVDDHKATANSLAEHIDAIQVDAAAIEVDTQDLQTQVGTAGAGLTDLGGMSTAMKGEVNAEADTALSDYDAPTKAEMDTAFTEIKGATWSGTTDTLEHIRNKQTDIETDTAEIGAAGAGLTEAGGTGDHLTAIPEVSADVTKISGDATAANNLESYCDGTTPQPVNVTQISGDATAADNLESYCDGTDNQPVDVKEINSVTAAATNLALACGEMEAGTVSHDNTAATTTVFYSDDITEATADHYKGRLVYFTSGALRKQVTDITDYAVDTGEGKFTVTALTEAPADNVTFIIL